MSDMLKDLWESGMLVMGVWETVYMTVISTVIAYILGLPLGVILAVTDRGGIRPIAWINKTLGVAVNILRSIPFILLGVCLVVYALSKPRQHWTFPNRFADEEDDKKSKRK